MSTRPLHPRPAGRPVVFAFAATTVVSAAAGWFARAPEVPAPAAQPAMGQPPAPAPARVESPAFTAPLIAVSSDGYVTLRVEQQPLHWVLEQISDQAGWPELLHGVCPAVGHAAGGASAASTVSGSPAAVVATPAPVLASCPESAAAQVDATRVLHHIESGTEAERFQGLMVARSADITVAETTLKQLYETGPSERVQVAAFEAYLALRADSPDALQAALEAGLYAPAPNIQREARQRLAELREMQRLNVLPPLADP